MKPVVKVEGLTQLQSTLRRLALEARAGNVDVVVGYSQDYAIYVHEDLDAAHAEGTQAKFLEEPMRRMRPELLRVVARVYNQTHNLVAALMTAGLKLQRASQKIVPVDTGALKASAFTRLEGGTAAMSGQAAKMTAPRERDAKGRFLASS